MMLRTYADPATRTFVTFGNVDGLTFNRQPVKASFTDEDIDVEGLPDSVVDAFTVDHFHFPAGEPATVNWVAWRNDEGFHLLLSDTPIFVMNDAGATIDRIGDKP